MFFLPLGIDVMVGLVAVGETIPDEGAQHTVLLVDAVEERTDMTMPIEKIAAEPHPVRHGLHIYLHLDAEGATLCQTHRFSAARFDPPFKFGHAAANGLRPGYVRLSALSTDDGPTAVSSGRTARSATTGDSRQPRRPSRPR